MKFFDKFKIENENYLHNTSSPTYPLAMQMIQEEKMINNYEKPILKKNSNSN